MTRSLRVKERRKILKVTKEEANYIRKNSKHPRITITGKGKKSRNKKWYVDESTETLALLDAYWESRVKI